MARGVGFPVTLSLCISISSSLKMELTSGTFHGVVRFQKGDMFESTQHPANYISFLRIALETEMFCFILGFLAVEKE